MKIRFFFIIFFCFGAFSYAQQTQTGIYQSNGRDKIWLLDITAGANIDLIRSGSVPESGLLGSKPEVVPALGIRLTRLFSDKIGWYTSLHINLFKSKKSEYSPSSIGGEVVEAFVDALLFPFTRIAPALDAGIIYRFERDRWKIHPGVGLGYMYYLPDSESSKTFMINDSEQSVSYRQHAAPLFLNVGLSVRHLLSRRGSLVADINFQQPLQNSHAELISHINGIETERKSYRTSTAGRNINFSLGYGITF